MKRRLLASILSLVMMLILLSTAVWARETGRGGSQETEDTAKLKPQSGEEGTPHETATSKGTSDLMRTTAKTPNVG